MTGFGDLLLNLRGFSDPRQQLVSALLGGGTGAGAPGAPGAGAGVRSPGGGQQPQAAAYQSPPDLLNLYSQLTDRQHRESRIDSGLGLLASTLVQPRHSDAAQAAFGGGGSGSGGADGTDNPLSLVMKIREAQMAAESAGRQRAALPAIAKQLGISEEEAGNLLDNGQLDDFISQQLKPNMTTMAGANGQLYTVDQNTGTQRGVPVGTEKPVDVKTQVIKDDKTGNQFLVDSNTGSKIAVYDTGLAPEKDGTQIVKDDATGKQFLVNKADGTVLKTYETGTSPTDDMKEWRKAVLDGTTTDTLPQWLEKAANLKAPKTTVNVDNSSDKLAEGFDAKLQDLPDQSAAAAKTMASVSAARDAMDAPGGIISGSAIAPAALEGRKLISSLFGLSDKAVANTDTFSSEMNTIVLPLVKQLGTGNSISDADVKFISKAIGADLATNPVAQRRVLSILEKGQRNQIIKNNERLQKRIDAETDTQKKARLSAAIPLQNVPNFSDSYLAQVNPADVATLKKAAAEKDQATIDEFDDTYGLGMSKYFLGAQ